MRNTFLTLVFTLVGVATYAQHGFQIGVQAGLPFNDFNDQASLFVGGEVGHMWALGEVIDLGITAGYIHGFAETFHDEQITVDLPDIQFAPVAVSIRIWPSRSFSVGTELGMGFGLTDGLDGGLYYRPTLGYMFGTQTEVNLSYTGIQLDDDVSWTTLNFGIKYTFSNKRNRF